MLFLLKKAPLLAIAALYLFLAACGGAATGVNEPGEVQDITPGERSVIQPPQSSPSGQNALEERNI